MEDNVIALRSRDLMRAVENGNLERVKAMVDEYGLPYFKCWSNGYYLLQAAANRNCTSVAELLLTKGADVNKECYDFCTISTPLQCAVEHSNITLIQMMIDKGADVNCKSTYSKSVLYIAVENKNVYITEILLKYGADVNSTDGFGTSVLQVAVRNKIVIFVEKLLKYGASTICPYNYYAPLHEAVGSTEIMKLLLNSGANVNVKGKDDITPLHIAACEGRNNIVTLLLNHGACVLSSTSKGLMPLHFACAQCNEETVILLLNRGADINASAKDKSTPLHRAVRENHTAIVKVLLENGANINNEDSEGRTVLNIAVNNMNELIVNYILKYSPDINNQSNSKSLNIAVLAKFNLIHPLVIEKKIEENKRIVELLSDYGFSIHPDDANNTELLVAAVGWGCIKIVKCLLEYALNMNMANIFIAASTLLHRAVASGHEEIARLLIRHGADVNALNQDNKLPMFYSIRNGNFKMSQLLLFNGAKVNHELLELAMSSSVEIVRAILQHDVDVNAVGRDGRTLLHITAEKEDYNYRSKSDIGEVVKFLLDNGANVDALDNKKQTPLHVAIQNGRIKVFKILLEHDSNKIKLICRTNPELLKLAVEKSVEFARAILQSDVNVNTVYRDGRTLLHIIAEIKDYSYGYGNIEEIIMLLLDKGANVDALDNKKQTPLHIAIQNGHRKVFKILLEHNANIKLNCGVENDITPLHLAAETRDVEIMTIILSNGVDINAVMKNGYTALHIAVTKGHVNVVNLLLKHGANIEQKTGDDNKPLHLAAEQYYYDIFESLLKFGAHINSRSIKDVKAVHHIADRNKQFGQVVDSLLEYVSDNKDKFLSDYDMRRVRVGGLFHARRHLLNLHIIRLTTASLFVEKENILGKELLFIESIKTKLYNNYILECEKEVANMKIEMISDKISFYDILKKDARSLAIPYMRNNQIVQVLKANEYWTNFPVYATMIESNFRRALAEKDLLEKAYTIIVCLFKHLPELPYNCTEEILSYLNNVDLQGLLNIFQSSK